MNWIRLAAVQFFAAVGLKLWPAVDSFFKKHKTLALLLFFSVFVILSFMALTGCSLVNQKLDPEKFYRRDIKLEINGEKFDGVAVPKRADEYEIKIKAKGKIDMLTIRSCHREEHFEEPSSGWFSSGKSFKYTFRPIKGIEDGRGCLLDIGAYEKEKGRHSWATIDFETETENLPAIVMCNGEKWNTDPGSVSICQARTGTIQKIIFDHRVKISPDEERCKVFKTKDEMTYEYLMPLGECVVYFADKYQNVHRHVSVGYDEILVRGGQ